jgi:hypothetical protein
MAQGANTGYVRLALFLFAVVILPVRGLAQIQPTTQGAGNDADWRRQMEQRQDRLEQENRNLHSENAELRQQIGQVKDTQQTVMKDAQAHGFLTLEGGQPRLTTPETFDTRKYVSEGDFPGSIRIPNTNVSFQIGGFVQLDAITDTHRIGSKDSFIVSSIPTDNDTAGQTAFSIRQTRLFVKAVTPTNLGDFVVYVEGDFFGADGAEFRIRHAYGELGDKHKFLAGQTFSTFMDASVYPAIFDYQGPNAMVLVRQPMIRWTEKVRDDLQWQVALEDPNPDVSEAVATPGGATSVFPDLTGNARWTPAWGHLQGAAILRQLIFDPDSGSRTNHLGWGLNFTGHVNVCEPVAKGKQDNVVFQLAGGQGIANYINDTSGLGLDGFVNSNGNLEALFIWGGFAAYQHYWSPKWGSTFGYSYLEVNNVSGQAPEAYHAGHYIVANIVFYPVDRITLGLEALYGIRQDNDGHSGEDGRLSFSAQYRF